ncbi:SoxR reducing system RseC family protein [bacterium]|nr:SoxR reducing system RseC family protein [bacterium]MBU1065483.1 SoxR reducing system RseC family protein [bacterium]MBU1634838.1 SoxR reducing system RseC family protein [bacterium]MBU1873142.1 SoxR reducing system RseC family protein [bacterium]
MDESFEIGVIVDIIDNIAEIELLENDHCHSCGARMICRPGDSGKRTLRLKNTLNAKIDDRILIEQSDKNQLQLTFMQYGFPLLGFLISIILAGVFIKAPLIGIPPEVLQFTIAVLVLFLAGWLTRIWATKKASTDFSVFSMKEICQ